jgi:hypothetical protein
MLAAKQVRGWRRMIQESPDLPSVRPWLRTKIFGGGIAGDADRMPEGSPPRASWEREEVGRAPRSSARSDGKRLRSKRRESRW